MENKNLYNENEAIIKGTIFKNLDKPYKNHTNYFFLEKCEKDEKLNEISKYDFAILDLSLALDLDPYNKHLLDFYTHCVIKYKKLKQAYETKYETISKYNIQHNEFDWVNDSWTI
ncbi:MAG: spore coat associated protein CotJA [Bacilli bacterium]